MRPRAAFAVGLAGLLLAGGVASVAGTAPLVEPHRGDRAPNVADQSYEISLDNVTVETWLLRDATVRNATVEEVVIHNATTPDGARANVTLSNVTVGEFAVERGRLLNVSATRLVVRNKSVLDVPGGEFIDPNVENRTVKRQWTRNATVAGVVIDRMRVDAAVLCANATLGEQADDPAAFDPQAGDDDPAITVENGSAEEALLIRGHASEWRVGSADGPAAENASLPQGCERGQGDDGGGDGDDGGGEGDDAGGGDGE
ncbi:hypothetical protein [Halorussus halobius]|uniref:hypothetical protein n=1 Tax=Halorussus halobius TaxID=1710537 RepID=UPI00143E0826|nr:hypothetical protein [Halorussus halobius]